MRQLLGNSPELDTEIFKGNATRKIKGPQYDPASANSYTYPSSGAHYKDAFDTSKGGVTSIIGEKNYINGTSYYDAKVEMYNQYLDQIVKKKRNHGFSTFFPDEWTKQKVQQEMTLVFKNKKYQYTNKGIDIYLGQMSDGVDCIMYIDKSKITSMHPSFN